MGIRPRPAVSWQLVTMFASRSLLKLLCCLQDPPVLHDTHVFKYTDSLKQIFTFQKSCQKCKKKKWIFSLKMKDGQLQFQELSCTVRQEELGVCCSSSLSENKFFLDLRTLWGVGGEGYLYWHYHRIFLSLHICLFLNTWENKKSRILNLQHF